MREFLSLRNDAAGVQLISSPKETTVTPAVNSTSATRSQLRRMRRKARQSPLPNDDHYVSDVAGKDHIDYIGDSIEDIYEALDYLGLPPTATAFVSAAMHDAALSQSHLDCVGLPPTATANISAAMPDVALSQSYLDCDEPAKLEATLSHVHPHAELEAGTILAYDASTSEDFVDICASPTGKAAVTTTVQGVTLSQAYQDCDEPAYLPSACLAIGNGATSPSQTVPDFLIRHYVPKAGLILVNDASPISASTPDLIGMHQDRSVLIHDAGIGDNASALDATLSQLDQDCNEPAELKATLSQLYPHAELEAGSIPANDEGTSEDFSNICVPPTGKAIASAAMQENTLSQVYQDCGEPAYVPVTCLAIGNGITSPSKMVPDFLIRHYRPETGLILDNDARPISASMPDLIGEHQDGSVLSHDAGIGYASALRSRKDAGTCENFLDYGPPTAVADVLGATTSLYKPLPFKQVPDFFIRHYGSETDLILVDDASPISASMPDLIGEHQDGSVLVHDAGIGYASALGFLSAELADTWIAVYKLPVPWKTVHDPNTDRFYYWNLMTNEVTWTPPHQDKCEPTQPARCDVVECRDEAGLALVNDTSDGVYAAGATPGAVIGPVRGGARISPSRDWAAPGAVIGPVRGGARCSSVHGSGDFASVGSPACSARSTIASGSCAAPGATPLSARISATRIRRWQR